MAMDWAPDFCLSCDRQTSNEAYCSQSCRLMDIERAGSDTSAAHMTAAAHSPGIRSSPTYPSTALTAGSSLYLPPPVDFAACRSSAVYAKTTASTSPTFLTSAMKYQPRHSLHLSSTVSAAYPTACTQTRSAVSPLQETSSTKASCHNGSNSERRLTPSSSGVSLSSLRSVSSCQSLSDQARAQLQIYVSSFDAIRDFKRRATLG